MIRQHDPGELLGRAHLGSIEAFMAQHHGGSVAGRSAHTSCAAAE